MTTEEKLEKAIEFIKSIANIEGALNRMQQLGTNYVDREVLDNLSSKAWHLLVDLTD